LSDLAKRGDLKWGTPENLEMLIDTYFTMCSMRDDKGVPVKVPNIAGLCLELDITKETFYYYSEGRYEQRLAIKAREEKQELIKALGGEEELQAIKEENGIFCQALLPYQRTDEIDSIKARVSDLLKRAKLQIENWNWDQGYRMSNPAMSIFALKAVHRYTDQPQELNLHQNNIQLNIKLDTTGAQKLQNQPTITVTAEPANS
jgi:hypothetical protein